MTTFTANISELEQTSADLKGSSEELHNLFEDYATNFMATAGIAYEEGTEVYNAMHEGVEAAVRKAEENVSSLLDHSAKASTTASNISDAENSSVAHIRGNIG